MHDDALEALTCIYEGIMSQMHVIAASPWEWADDLFDWWEAAEYREIKLSDIDLISAYLDEKGLLEGRGVIYAIGEWLYEHHRHVEYEPRHMKVEE